MNLLGRAGSNVRREKNGSPEQGTAGENDCMSDGCKALQRWSAGGKALLLQAPLTPAPRRKDKGTENCAEGAESGNGAGTACCLGQKNARRQTKRDGYCTPAGTGGAAKAKGASRQHKQDESVRCATR